MPSVYRDPEHFFCSSYCPPVVVPKSVQYQQRREALGGNGSAIEIALRLIALQQAQQISLLLGFHSLGDNLEVKVVGKGDYRVDDPQISRIGGHFCDEGAIDLQFIDGQRYEIGERRVTGAEVVNGNRYADSSQRAQNLWMPAVHRSSTRFP